MHLPAMYLPGQAERGAVQVCWALMGEWLEPLLGPAEEVLDWYDFNGVEAHWHSKDVLEKGNGRVGIHTGKVGWPR